MLVNAAQDRESGGSEQREFEIAARTQRDDEVGVTLWRHSAVVARANTISEDPIVENAGTIGDEVVLANGGCLTLGQTIIFAGQVGRAGGLGSQVGADTIAAAGCAATGHFGAERAEITDVHDAVRLQGTVGAVRIDIHITAGVHNKIIGTVLAGVDGIVGIELADVDVEGNPATSGSTIRWNGAVEGRLIKFVPRVDQRRQPGLVAVGGEDGSIARGRTDTTDMCWCGSASAHG